MNCTTDQADSVRPKVVAAIPCFNTERFIAELVSRVRKFVDQVIVIDDGSQDNTAKIASDAGALVISQGANRGYGEAINSCFKQALAQAADILVILDGDGQHSPNEIPKLLAPILSKEADLVIGSRFVPQISPVQLTQKTTMPRYRAFGIRVITLLFNLGSRVKVSDAQSGFRAYSKRVFQTLHLSEKGMSVSIEILEEARRSEAIISEVPIDCFYLPSHLNLKAFKHGTGVALSVLRIRLKKICLDRRLAKE